MVFNLWASLFVIILFFLTGSYRHLSFPTEPLAYVFMLVACAAYAAFERWRFTAAKLLEASVLSIISNLSAVIAFVLAVFLYSEPLTVEKIIGGGLIIFALFLVNWTGKSKEKVSLKGIMVATFIFTALGVAWSLDKKGAQYFNADTYQIFVWIVPLVFIYFPYVKRSELIREAKRTSWKVVLLAILNVVGYYLQLKAFELTEATLLIPVLQTSTLLTVALAIIIFGEKEHKYKKVIAAIIALFGSYLLITQ